MSDETKYVAVFGVDVDDVVADFHSAFRDFVSRQLHREIGALPTHWGFEEWGIDNDILDDLFSQFIDDGGYQDLKPMPGASEVLWRLSDAGVYIRVVTHRLFIHWHHLRMATDTVQWLDTYKIPYRDLCMVADKPDVAADVNIDDAAHNILALRKSGRTTLVYDRPWNQEVAGPRVRNWSEVWTWFCEHYPIT